MFAKSNRYMFALGLIFAAGLFAIFVFSGSHSHTGHVEASGSPKSGGLVAPSAAIVTVSLQNNRFNPATVNITTGTTVRWNWVNGFHSTTSGDCCDPNGIWDSGSTGVVGTNFDYTFSTPGTFPYFCMVHGQMMTGTVVVTAATTATISGRVLGPNGRGIKGARVILTDQANVARNVTANHMGAYQFSNVTTGQNYTLSVQARRCTFTPRSLSVSGNLTNEDIICQ